MSDMTHATVHACVGAVGSCVANMSPNELVSFCAGLLTVVYMIIMITINVPRIPGAVKELRARVRKWTGRE